MRRRRWSGLSPAGVLAFLVLLALFAAGIWVYKHAGGGGSSFDMASYLPGSTRAAVMINMQGQIDPDKVRASMEEILTKMPPADRQKLEDDIKTELGVSWTELGKFFDGRGAMALTIAADKPGAVMLIGLRDPAGLEALIKPKLPPSVKTEKVAGLDFYVGEAGGYAGHDQNWLYVTDSKVSAELLVAAAGGKDTLSAQATFVQARDKVQGQGSLMSCYWDIGPTIASLQALKPPYTDEQTFKELGCLKWAVANVDYRGGVTEAFLKVAPEGTSLGSKLLTKGSVSATTFSGLSQGTSFGQAVDVEWVFNSTLAAVSLVPEARSYASMVPMGYAMVGNPWACFEGDVAFTGDWVGSAGSIFSQSFGAARAQGQLAACSSNLKNIGTAAEMWSTDNAGRYPANLAQLTPGYLQTLPECPAAGSDTYSATYKITTQPDGFVVACAGNHHRQSVPNLPAYDSQSGLNSGTPIEGGDSPDLIPSLAFCAPVKDIKMTHGLLLKHEITDSAEPKPGEERDYDVPGGTLKLTGGTPPLLLLGLGPNPAPLLDTKSGTLANHPSLAEVLAWGGDAAIYADYMDLRPIVESIEKGIPAETNAENDLARLLIDKAKSLDLQAATCITVRDDGLHLRCHGITSGAFLLTGGMAAAIAIPYMAARPEGSASPFDPATTSPVSSDSSPSLQCQSNLKNIATALEMWSTDNSGKYPNSLSELIPGSYLKEIPICPAAGSDTYSSGYTHLPLNGTEHFVVVCKGHHHGSDGMPEDFPRYDAVSGLTTSP